MQEKILIVDDQKENRALLSDFLEMQGYQLFEAENGAHAIEQALTHKPDLILMDVMMPKLNGYEACALLKKNELTKDIPVIFLSSLTESKDKIKGFEVGGEDFFVKFGDLSELQARVQAHLKIRFLTQSLKQANQELIKKQNALNDDLTSAALIQRSLLPPTTLSKLDHLEIACECMPSLYIGGDIFNFIRLDEERVAFYMLDVCGHGVPSAMVAVSVSQYFHELINQAAMGNYSKLLFPGQLLKDLNKQFSINRFGKYFTIFYLVINETTGRIFHSLAGHPPGILLHQDKPYELLNVGGSVIGVDEFVPFSEDSKEIKKGDKIVLYTDGIIELDNQEGEFFGMDRFLEFLETIKNKAPQEIINLTIDKLHYFKGSEPVKDDISIMCIHYF